MKTLSETLIDLGEKRTVSKVVEVLSDGNPHKFHDIEVATELRESEVSIALKKIAGYIEVSRLKSEGIGRPQKLIIMYKPNLDRYLNSMLSETTKKHIAIVDSMADLAKYLECVR